MLLRQLEYLTTLARERHFARAADACYVSQPAMSAAIHKLEAELHVQIVQRGNRFIGFTPEGERILQWAYRILAERDALIDDVGTMREGLSGRLRIGSIPTALCVVPILTSLLCEAQPNVRIMVTSQTSIEIQRGLSQYGLDAGVTYIDNEPLANVRTVPLYPEQYLLLADENQLAGRTTATWPLAAELPLCLLTEDMQNRRILNSVFEQAQVRPQPAVETDSISALYSHVKEGPWATVLPHTWLLRFGIPDGMRAVPLTEPEIRKTIGIVLHERDPEPILAKALIDTAQRIDLQSILDLPLRG